MCIRDSNYGCGQLLRSNKALRLCIISAVVFALLISGVFVCFSGDIVSLFLPDRTSHAWQYAVAGLPLFAVDYIFFGINVITIGYYTSIERINLAMRLTLLRGILPVLFFFIPVSYTHLLPLMGKAVLMLALIYLVIQMKSTEIQPFIYFQF